MSSERSAQQVNRLIQLTSTEGHTKVDFSKFEQLPPPVARYFRLALRDGQSLIRIARFSQTGIYTPERYGRFDGEYELRPWEGHFRNYEERNGIMVPMEGEVGWHLPDGWWSFWKGNIIQINYDFTQ